ncbi:MAG: hypothetical protein AAGJ37_03410 [Pseudomonadota bacterium]
MTYATPAQLSQIIQNKQFHLVEQEIVEIIRISSQNMNFIKLPMQTGLSNMSAVQYEQQCINTVSSYANLIVQMFCHPQYVPSDEVLHVFTVQKEVVEAIFTCSAWGNTDPIIDKLGLMDLFKKREVKLNDKNLLKLRTLLALICLGSKHKLPWPSVFNAVPNLAVGAFIGLVSQSGAIVNQRRNDYYNHLLEVSSSLPMVSLNKETDAFALVTPYFYCSYSEYKNKYQLKQWIVKLITFNLKQWLSKDVLDFSHKVEQRPIGSRPRIGVVLEKYQRTHAMYRSFNSMLKGLSKEYDLVAFVDEESVKTADLSVFESYQAINIERGLNKIATDIMQSNVDILFYPSIGMKQWSTCLANIRLAPIQVMAGGHPSSSYSDAMDYFVIPTDGFTADDIQGFINEKAVICKADKVKLSATRHPQLTDELIEKHSSFLDDEDEMRIGINGVIRKVSYETIKACAEISRRSTKKIKFILFSQQAHSNVAGLAIKLQLQKELKHYELRPYENYTDYLKTMSTCHLLLPTLPFGGSNSNVDAMILKKPKLFLDEKKHLYTRSDFMDWFRVGLSDEFGCGSLAELIERTVAIIDNKAERKRLYELMIEHCDVNNILHGEKVDVEKGLLNPHFSYIVKMHQSTTNSNLSRELESCNS